MKPFQCLFDDPFVLLLLLWNAKVVTESPQLPVSRTYATTFPPKLSQTIVVSYKCQDKIHFFFAASRVFPVLSDVLKLHFRYSLEINMYFA